MSTPMPVREWRDVSATTFRNEIMPARQPALVRGAVRHWPAAVAQQPCHGADALRHLLQHRLRGRWPAAVHVFEHHIFETDGSPVAHLLPTQRGIQGTLDQKLALHMRSWLVQSLTPRRR